VTARWMCVRSEDELGAARAIPALATTGRRCSAMP
jgi:hypothetical protein